MLDRVHSQNGLLLVDWLFIASPSQTSQHARPCALPKRLLIGCLWPPLPRMLDLVHSQNGCLLHDYSLFVASLPKLPSMPDLVLTLCTPKTVVYGLFMGCLLPPFPECSTLCTPKTVYCLFIRCLLPPLPRMPDLVHSRNGLLLVDWLFMASPSQTSQHARPCAHLVHSQNGCDWLFMASPSQNARPCALPKQLFTA
jgi:hypothetical protein